MKILQGSFLAFEFWQAIQLLIVLSFHVSSPNSKSENQFLPLYCSVVLMLASSYSVRTQSINLCTSISLLLKPNLAPTIMHIYSVKEGRITVWLFSENMSASKLTIQIAWSGILHVLIIINSPNVGILHTIFLVFYFF